MICQCGDTQNRTTCQQLKYCTGRFYTIRYHLSLLSMWHNGSTTTRTCPFELFLWQWWQICSHLLLRVKVQLYQLSAIHSSHSASLNLSLATCKIGILIFPTSQRCENEMIIYIKHLTLRTEYKFEGSEYSIKSNFHHFTFTVIVKLHPSLHTYPL